MNTTYTESYEYFTEHISTFTLSLNYYLITIYRMNGTRSTRVGIGGCQMLWKSGGTGGI